MTKAHVFGNVRVGAEWNMRDMLFGISLYHWDAWSLQVGLGPFSVWVVSE